MNNVKNISASFIVIATLLSATAARADSYAQSIDINTVDFHSVVDIAIMAVMGAMTLLLGLGG